ncbi:MAG: hypothetical protein ABH950_05645 [Candidatus Altiarchaeota archaeon]
MKVAKQLAENGCPAKTFRLFLQKCRNLEDLDTVYEDFMGMNACNVLRGSGSQGAPRRFEQGEAAAQAIGNFAVRRRGQILRARSFKRAGIGAVGLTGISLAVFVGSFIAGYKGAERIPENEIPTKRESWDYNYKVPLIPDTTNAKLMRAKRGAIRVYANVAEQGGLDGLMEEYGEFRGETFDSIRVAAGLVAQDSLGLTDTTKIPEEASKLTLYAALALDMLDNGGFVCFEFQKEHSVGDVLKFLGSKGDIQSTIRKINNAIAAQRHKRHEMEDPGTAEKGGKQKKFAPPASQFAISKKSKKGSRRGV